MFWLTAAYLFATIISTVLAEDRCLHILICDDRPEVARRAADTIFTPALKSNSDNLKVTHSSICEGKPTDQKMMKAFYTLQYVKENANKLCDISQNYVLVLDTDMWWNSNSLSKLWTVYDNERKNKDVLVSSQDYCWIGRNCKREDFQDYFPNPSHEDSDPYSMFYNAGAIMGSFAKVGKMFKWMVDQGDLFGVQYPKGNLYDEQYAVTAYSTTVHPEDVQLDIKQALAAIPSIISQNNNWHNYLFGRRCKEVVSCRSSKMSMNTVLLPNHCVLLSCPHDMIITDSNSCLLTRNLTAYLDHNSKIDRLEPFPLMFHFAGDTKRMGHEAYSDRQKCAADKGDNRKQIWTGYRYNKLRHN